jgi:hypothetical protein
MLPTEAFQEQLAILEAMSLRRRPTVDDQVALSSKLVESFDGMSAKEREEVRSVLFDSALRKKLLSLSGYMAEVAINLQRPDLLRVGLALNAIEGLSDDFRENTKYLILIAFAAGKLGVALSPIVTSVLSLVSEDARVRLDEFSRRDFGTNLLSSFGLRADGEPGNFRFVPAS